MQKNLLIIILGVILLNSCITIEDEPFLTMSPTVTFQGHLRHDSVFVTATVNTNAAFTNPGNIPTNFVYEGTVELYNSDTGELIATQDITGDAISAIVEVATNAEDFDEMVVIASGSISAYADKESDGDLSNDQFITKSNFYQVISLAEVVNVEAYPVVTLSPDVDFQAHIRGTDLYTTSVVTANPVYLNTGGFPILFEFNGVIQVYDVTSGALLRSSAISGDGLSNAVTVVTDTTNFSGFVIISSGTITCTGDIESDGISSDDIFISSAEFYGLLDVDLEE